jgi:hypothetical protein
MKIQPLTESENETEEEIEIANTAARRVVKLFYSVACLLFFFI